MSKGRIIGTIAIWLTRSALVYFLAVNSAAQTMVFRRPFQILFPTMDWKETEPPEEMREFFNSGKTPQKLILHAVSEQSKIRLHVIRMEYQGRGPNPELSVAGVLDGTLKRCARQAVGEVAESMELLKNSSVPAFHFKGKAKNDLFFQMVVIPCSNHVYSVEMNGPSGVEREVARCVEGISLVGEQGLSTEFLNKVAGIRQKTAQTRAATRAAYEFGKISTQIMLTLATIGGLGFAIWRAHKPKKSLPPPLPPKLPPPLR